MEDDSGDEQFNIMLDLRLIGLLELFQEYRYEVAEIFGGVHIGGEEGDEDLHGLPEPEFASE